MRRKEVDLCDMNLSVRAFNCLYRSGIRTSADVHAMTAEEILAIHGIGQKTCSHILQADKKLEASDDER